MLDASSGCLRTKFNDSDRDKRFLLLIMDLISLLDCHLDLKIVLATFQRVIDIILSNVK